MSDFLKLLPAIQYQKCSSLFSDLLNVPYAHIKGDALSFQAYGKTGRREFSDIDVLISKKNLCVVEEILRKNGFECEKQDRKTRLLQLSSLHQTAPWHKEIPPFGTIELDLNFDVLWENDVGASIDIGEFLSDTQLCELHGLPVKVLAKEKAFLQMILHHYKHINSVYSLLNAKSIRREFFEDVGAFWNRLKSENAIRTLLDVSYRYRVTPYVYYMLFYTKLVFPQTITAADLNILRTSEGEALLDCYGLNQKERRMWNVDFFTRLNSKREAVFIEQELSLEEINRLRTVSTALSD